MPAKISEKDVKIEGIAWTAILDNCKIFFFLFVFCKIWDYYRLSSITVLTLYLFKELKGPLLVKARMEIQCACPLPIPIQLLNYSVHAHCPSLFNWTLQLVVLDNKDRTLLEGWELGTVYCKKPSIKIIRSDLCCTLFSLSSGGHWFEFHIWQLKKGNYRNVKSKVHEF